MAFMTVVKEKVINVLSLLKTFCADLFSRLISPPESSSQGSSSPLSKILGNKMLMLIGLGGVAGLLLILMIIIAVSGPRDITIEETAYYSPLGFTINPDDLFLPSEPVFVPDFVLEQEPRSFWSLEDIRSFWRAPAEIEGGNQIWRSQIRGAVDTLLEGVP
ncbi:MAG: hypothetical protein FWG77_11960 [Treponema sp.]|nr:hypothetical protein [Treponema sp.]